MKFSAYLRVMAMMAIPGFFSTAWAAYTPPVGIPAPLFGIEEVAPPAPSQWPGGEAAGYYYVDMDHPNATDTANTYGYPNKPRVSIPTTLSAGSYVEIHNSTGGAYTGNSLTITTSGTPTSPVWIRGKSGSLKPTLQRELNIRGSYAIYENLFFNADRKDVSISSADHISFRSNEMAGPGINSGHTAAVGISGANNIVVYNNRIHGWGDRQSPVENDYHGVKPSSNAEYIWILNNEIFDMSGDSVQVGDATIPDETRPSHVYIGGNIFHDNMENAIDIKEANHVIVSGNTIYGFRSTTTSSGGSAIVIHNNPDYVWVLNNKVFDSNVGITTTGSSNTYILGNLIYNITHSGTWDPSSAYQNGAAVHVRGTSDPTYIVSNTLYGNDIGIQSPSHDVRIYNNIISNRNTTDGNDIHLGSVNPGSDMDYNLFYYSGGSVRIRWGDGASRSLSGFKTTFGKGMNCPPEALPRFVDAAFGNFDTHSASPAIDAGVRNIPYTTFLSLYGLNIERDILGRSRPLGPRWDIGAYESEGTAGGAAPIPSPPTNLTIH